MHYIELINPNIRIFTRLNSKKLFENTNIG